MFKNKHVIVALIVAPILALISYFAVDYMVSEKPQAAKPGTAYPLVAKSNCRYTSGRCRLENGDFVVTVTVPANTLKVTSPHVLSHVEVYIATDSDDTGDFIHLQPNEDGRHWSVSLPVRPTESHLLRIVTIAADTIYYGETILTFMNYQTSFSKDFERL